VVPKIAKYYIRADSDDSAEEISNAKFDAPKSKLKKKDVTIISIEVKSIEKIKFFAFYDKDKDYNEMNFEVSY
jgi:hypothetical protein